MSHTTRVFRVFVSSTFEDLKAERNALQRDVFPRLQELCQQHGCRFQGIDLRWGVSEEAGLDQRTVKICLEEVARCQDITPRPNFIVLLGDRYGWTPLPVEIPLDEFDMIKNTLPSGAARQLLKDWYSQDYNSVPAVAWLKPRTGPFRDRNRWEREVENPLHAILLRAVEALGLADEALGSSLRTT